MTRFLDAVLFDLDLTLGRPVGDMSFTARQAALYASVGLPYTEADLIRAATQRREAIQAGRLRGVIRAQRMRDLLTAYRQMLTLLGFEGDVRAKARELYDGYARLPFVPYDDACPTLETLAAQGYRLGIISNHTPIARPVVEGRLRRPDTLAARRHQRRGGRPQAAAVAVSAWRSARRRPPRAVRFRGRQSTRRRRGRRGGGLRPGRVGRPWRTKVRAQCAPSSPASPNWPSWSPCWTAWPQIPRPPMRHPV